MKINKYLKFFLNLAIYFLVFYLLFNASINMVIFPFAFGMLFALAWANQKVWLLVPAYIGAGVLYAPTLEQAICLLAVSFCLLVPYFIHVLCKKNMRKWEFFAYASISQTAQIVFAIFADKPIWLEFVALVIGLLFMFACITVFEAVIIRGFSNKLTNLEIVSLFVIIGAFCSALSVLNIQNFSLLKLFVAFILLIFAFCSTPLLTLLVASVAGIGSLVATNNPLFVAPFILWALSMLLFKKRHKIFMVISFLCVEVVIGFYFKLYYTFGWVEALPAAIASLVFLCIPNKLTSEIAVIFNLSKDRLAMKNIVNRNREILHKRLGNLAEVFYDMNVIYRKMLKTTMSLDDVKSILEQEICEKICSFCPERNHCHRTFAENTKQVFDQLITICFERGKATLLDIPSYLTSRCKQTTAILGSVNTLTLQYKKYLTMSSDVDTSKVIIAEQLLGVSKVVGKLSKEVEENVSFDTVRENKILDELTYYNIICIDAVVFQKDVWQMMTSVVVRNDDAQKPRIAEVVSKVCGQKMAVYENYASSRPGYSVINLRTAPKYDCVFGVAQKTKNGSKVSGDTYSIIRLDGDKILFAINDGMGSGDKAERASELSISLVENFYKAGFDNDIILSTVNKLLNLHKEEIFSALDICIVDEKNGLADFIKMASPKSYILSEEKCEEVCTGALPIGIVDNIEPLVKKNVIDVKDFVIMLSDGIADSFKDDQEFVDCLKSIKTKNPQEIADQILERALACNNGYAVDDMTVLVVKILNF